ncbi:MAG: AAA family ATPase, partial [Gemmatimonadales bacterium]|nr:AAA family ATPase [Gemmatimonadales bacterium]
MLIHRLALRNFRQHEATELELGPGLTGIIGPNGAGKSTLLEAIAWAIYGTRAARGAKETIRRRGTGGRARVEVTLEFTLPPHRWRVERSLHGAELYLDGEASPVATGPGDVTDKLVAVLGMQRDEFFNTYFTGQKELAVMAAMGPTERGQFLSRVLGYENLRLAQERVREQRSALRQRLAGLEGALGDRAPLEAAVAEATATIASAGAAAEQAAAAAAAADARLAELRPRRERLATERERARQLENDRRLAAQASDEATRRLAALAIDRAEAAAAEGRLAELEPRLAGLAALRDERARLDRAQAE